MQLDYDGKTVPLPFNFAILEWAAGTREVLNKTQIPDGVSFYNIYGTSFDTPFDVWYVAEYCISRLNLYVSRDILK